MSNGRSASDFFRVTLRLAPWHEMFFRCAVIQSGKGAKELKESSGDLPINYSLTASMFGVLRLGSR
jgi:hypothetical protein